MFVSHSGLPQETIHLPKSVWAVTKLEQSPVAPGHIRDIPTFEIGGGAIATPGPPGNATGAEIKFLPLFAMVFSENGRSPINPNVFGFCAGSTTGRA
jgi:hypothetical protein